MTASPDRGQAVDAVVTSILARADGAPPDAVEGRVAAELSRLGGGRGRADSCSPTTRSSSWPARRRCRAADGPAATALARGAVVRRPDEVFVPCAERGRAVGVLHLRQGAERDDRAPRRSCGLLDASVAPLAHSVASGVRGTPTPSRSAGAPSR